MDWFESFVKLAVEKRLKDEGLSKKVETKESNGPEDVTVETDEDANREVRKAQISNNTEGTLYAE